MSRLEIYFFGSIAVFQLCLMTVIFYRIRTYDPKQVEADAQERMSRSASHRGRPHWSAVVFTSLFFVIPSVLFVFGVKDHFDRLSVIKHGEIVSGDVVKMYHSSRTPGSDTSESFYITYNYTTHLGETFTDVDSVSERKFKKTDKGEAIKVRYDTTKPSNSTVELKESDKWGIYILALLCIPCILISGRYLLKWTRRAD